MIGTALDAILSRRNVIAEETVFYVVMTKVAECYIIVIYKRVYCVHFTSNT